MNTSSTNQAQQDKPTFFDKPSNVNTMMRIFYVLSFLLVLVDFFIHRHELYLKDGNIIKMLEQFPTFYAVYGFVGCSLLVFGAQLMRLFLMKKENFYDERSDERFYVENPIDSDQGAHK